MKLLIIEDDVAFANTLKRRLERQQFEVALAHEGATALLTARQHLPDYIVLDMKLAADSGLELIKPLRNLRPESRIILLTGFASIATAVEAMRLGADDYLAKPVDSQTLTRALLGETSIEISSDDSVMSTERLEWEHIQQVLASNSGNVSATARQLGMHRRTLQRKLQKKPAAK